MGEQKLQIYLFLLLLFYDYNLPELSFKGLLGSIPEK